MGWERNLLNSGVLIMPDGISKGVLTLGGVDFTSLDLPQKVNIIGDMSFTVESVPSTYQIPDYNSANKYLVTLSETTNTSYSYMVGMPVPSNIASISSTGLVTINTVVGTYFVHEFQSSTFVNRGIGG